MRVADHIEVGGPAVTIESVVRVARTTPPVRVSASAKRKMRAGRSVVEGAITAGVPIYGVTTGFGALSATLVSPEEQRAIQPRILRSHATGTGRPLDDEVIRAVIFLRANMLARGFSGVRPVVVENLLALLNAGLTPIVPEQGSVGASGDLAPLAHLSLPLIGEGEVRTARGVRPADGALRSAGIEPLVLEAKEASSLTNGTELSLGLATLAVHDAGLLIEAAEIAAAMSFAAMRGHHLAFDERIQAVRPHPGQRITAQRMRALLRPPAGEIAHEARRPVHDIYSLRCVPQVLGPVRGALTHVRTIVEIELNSVTDNPVCFAETGEVISGGNFHGHPIAVASDYLKAAVSSVGTFSERRTAGLLDSRTSGLPDLLTPRPAQNSGFMLVQYAAASLASENKTLSHPSSVDSIVTAGGAEDFNSMSATAARHLRDVVANTTRIVAMEMLCAAQALDMAGGTNATGVAAAQAVIRNEVPFVREDDHIMSHLVAAVESLIKDGRVQRVVAEALTATS